MRRHQAVRQAIGESAVTVADRTAALWLERKDPRREEAAAMEAAMRQAAVMREAAEREAAVAERRAARQAEMAERANWLRPLGGSGVLGDAEFMHAYQVKWQNEGLAKQPEAPQPDEDAALAQYHGLTPNIAQPFRLPALVSKSIKSVSAPNLGHSQGFAARLPSTQRNLPATETSVRLQRVQSNSRYVSPACR